MSTPFDEGATDFLLSLGMRHIKVSSGEITNEPFLEFLAKKDCSMIISTGMANLEEIERAVEVIRQARQSSGLHVNLAEVLTILHCTSNYPAAYCDVNLRAMETIGKATGLPIGYSDHTLGFSVSIAAVAMGARVIEKHFTISRELQGPDHKTSLEPHDLKILVNQIRDIQDALGSPKKIAAPSELPIRDLVRRSITLTRDMKRGEILCPNDMTLLRPGTGISPADLKRLAGCALVRDLPKGTTLQWIDIN
jgi:N,N'-diacetyllegionaminate synthase